MIKQIINMVDKVFTTAIFLLGIGAISFLFLTKTEATNIRGYHWGSYAFELQKKLFELGYNANDTVIIINNCKKSTTNVGRCIRTAGMIGFAESGSWQRCLHNACMGIRRQYNNKDEMFKDWIVSYNKYWYKHPEPGKYYGDYPLTGYCYSEAPKYIAGQCPNGLRNSTYAFNLLNK